MNKENKKWTEGWRGMRRERTGSTMQVEHITQEVSRQSGVQEKEQEKRREKKKSTAGLSSGG